MNKILDFDINLEYRVKTPYIINFKSEFDYLYSLYPNGILCFEVGDLCEVYKEHYPWCKKEVQKLITTLKLSECYQSGDLHLKTCIELNKRNIKVFKDIFSKYEAEAYSGDLFYFNRENILLYWAVNFIEQAIPPEDLYISKIVSEKQYKSYELIAL